MAFVNVAGVAGLNVGGRYAFEYNNKKRVVEIVNVLMGNGVNGGGKSDYIHCQVIEDDGELMLDEVFKNFTVAKIQGPIVKVAIE